MNKWLQALRDLPAIIERIKKMPTTDELKAAIQDALNAQLLRFTDALDKEKGEVKQAITDALATSHPITDKDKADILAMIDGFGTKVTEGVDTIQVAEPVPPPLP